jgi:hypothetical protein
MGILLRSRLGYKLLLAGYGRLEIINHAILSNCMLPLF